MPGQKVIARFELAKDANLEDFLKKVDKFAKTNKIKHSILGETSKDGQTAVMSPNKELEIMMNLGDKSDLKIPEYAPKDFTQQGIAEKVGLDVSVVSRYLKNLRQRKLVKHGTMNIIGDARRRRVYFLTKKGKDLLDQLMK